MELQKNEIRHWEREENKEIYRIKDLNRLIFLVELDAVQGSDLESYVNKLMDWITYEHQSEEKDLADGYQQITMRKILWDLYVIFINYSSEKNEGISEEEAYSIQRDSRFMKRYLVQGESDDEIAKKISFIVRPEKRIDNFINKLEFDNEEEEQCRQMCHTKEGNGFGFEAKTYQGVTALLKKINEETFGEDLDENT